MSTIAVAKGAKLKNNTEEKIATKTVEIATKTVKIPMNAAKIVIKTVKIAKKVVKTAMKAKVMIKIIKMKRLTRNRMLVCKTYSQNL